MRRQEETFTKSHIYLWCRTSRERRKKKSIFSFFSWILYYTNNFLQFLWRDYFFFSSQSRVIMVLCIGSFYRFRISLLSSSARSRWVELYNNCQMIFGLPAYIFVTFTRYFFFFQNLRLIKERRLENCVQKWFCSTMTWTRIGIESFKDLQSTHKKNCQFWHSVFKSLIIFFTKLWARELSNKRKINRSTRRIVRPAIVLQMKGGSELKFHRLYLFIDMCEIPQRAILINLIVH